MLLRRAEAHHRLDAGAVVPGAVEDARARRPPAGSGRSAGSTTRCGRGRRAWAGRRRGCGAAVRCSVIRAIVPSLPAASRPSKITTALAPVSRRPFLVAHQPDLQVAQLRACSLWSCSSPQHSALAARKAKRVEAARDPTLRHRATCAAGARFAASSEQAHYLVNVMRLATGDELLAVQRPRRRVARAPRRRSASAAASWRCWSARATSTSDPTSIWSSRWSSARGWRPSSRRRPSSARGACGSAITERTNAEHTRVDRLAAIAVEAAEQTGRLDVPEVERRPKLERAAGGLAGRPRR